MDKPRCLCELAGTRMCNPVDCPYPAEAQKREAAKRERWQAFKRLNEIMYDPADYMDQSGTR